MNEMNDPRVTVGAVIPMSWKDKLEEMAKAEGKSVSEVVREFTDKGLHGQSSRSQATQCYDYVARQIIRTIVDLLQLYYTTEGRADLTDG